MTIEIKPAEIVGAAVGDRVTWDTDTYAWYGTLLGLSQEYPGRLVVEITHRGSERDTGRRHIEPERLSLAPPRKYKVGDEVGEADLPHLPDGALLVRVGFLPAFKAQDTWHVIDAETPGGVREVPMYEKNRTIAWLPQKYTNQ